MTTYTAITNAQVDVDSPITQTLMTLLRDNPLAINELAAGAPKPYWKIISSNSANPLDILSIGDFQGFHAFGSIDPTSISGSIALSDDNGSTWGTSSNISLNLNLAQFELFLDFTTGNFYWCSEGGSYSTGTVANASANVDAVRLDLNAGGTGQGIFVQLLGKEAV